MNNIPYDVELIIYKYLHMLYMNDIFDEINNINQTDIPILNYLKISYHLPYVFWTRLIKIKTNRYYKTVIDRYVHKKRMFRVFKEIKIKN